MSEPKDKYDGVDEVVGLVLLTICGWAIGVANGLLVGYILWGLV